MTKSEILHLLPQKHREFSDYILSLSDQEFLASANGKWTPGQHFDHIRRSVRPLALLRILPKFIVGLIFGRANRPSKDYEGLVRKYLSVLEQGGKASGAFIPKTVTPAEKESIKRELLQSVNTLVRGVQKYSEQQLDTFILPHPLLGKLTLREMLYFTLYHVEHHQAGARRNLTEEQGN